MRIDWYTKGVLTVIAMLLGVIVSKLYAKPPEPVAQADAPFAGVQYAPGNFNFDFFDPKTGEVWQYEGGTVFNHFRLTKLGAPLVHIK